MFFPDLHLQRCADRIDASGVGVRGERNLGRVIYTVKGGLGRGDGNGMGKTETKEGCVFERMMGKFRDLNVEVRGWCFL